MDDVLEKVPNLGLVIDLTNTNKYYDGQVSDTKLDLPKWSIKLKYNSFSSSELYKEKCGLCKDKMPWTCGTTGLRL